MFKLFTKKDKSALTGTAAPNELVRIEEDIVCLASMSISDSRENSYFVRETITITQGGHFTGRIIANNVVIEGNVTGDIICEGLLTIAATGFVAGDIWTNKANIKPGATLTGNLFVGPESVPDTGLSDKIEQAESLLLYYIAPEPSPAPTKPAPQQTTVQELPESTKIAAPAIKVAAKPVETSKSSDEESGSWW